MSTLSQLVPENTPEIDDRGAVAAVVGGNPEFFAVIVRRYNTQLYRIGMAYLGHHEQAEDAMQNAYLKAYSHLARFRGESRFSTWLTRIMINECLMTLRRRRQFTIKPIEECVLPDETSPVAGDALRTAEMRALLEDAVSRLPRFQRTVYMLREIQGASVQDVADCLHLTPANVKVTLHRARERLKQSLLRNASGAELFDYPAQFCDPMTQRVMSLILRRPA